jgi:hypothetical protein
MPKNEPIILTPEERELLSNYEKLTQSDKDMIIRMKKELGMSIDEISRRYRITPPDVNRILKPPVNYGNWSPEEKMRHWVAGKRRAATVKRQRDERMKNKKI